MSRPTTKWLLLAALTISAVTSACTRSDVTGPSDQTAPAFENQGSNN